ncbi:radical SAM protein [Nonomuraea sp. NPDC050643]|uniref:radical SAM protein n=1 Tax=Nonomuraea sp. NPDC050643 TaxID=3155660 RepID=UPI0033FB3B4A
MSTGTTSRRMCHLLEITPMPDVRYSLNLGYLHATAAADEICRDGYEFVKHVIFQAPGLVNSLHAWLESIDRIDVLAISVYFWNRRPSMYIADEVKKRWPGCTIIMGGNEVTNQTDIVFAESAAVDILVHGEGEFVFRDLLRTFVDDDIDRREEIAGVSFRRGGETIVIPTGARISDLSTIPSPLLSGVYSSADIRDSRIIILETNRGCPYSCAFCYWGGATQSKVRAFPLERIKDEITYIVTHASQDATLFLADANFGILPQDVEIAQWLVSELQRLGKRMFLFTNWAKNTSKRVLAIADILYSGNLIAAVTLSAQSFAPEVLQIAKRSNIKPDYYRILQREFQDRGIPTYTELIWGMPGETLQTFLSGIEYVISSGGHPVVYPLLLLNNTEYTTERFRGDHSVRTRRLPYQITNPEMVAEFVVEHSHMPERDWIDGMEFRLTMALFYGCLLRGILKAVSHRTGRRVVDLCMMLTEFLREADPKTTLGALLANHRAIWTDPSAFDGELVVEFVDADSIPEHMHYQAIMRHLLETDLYASFVRSAAAYLLARLDSGEIDEDEYEELVEHQVLNVAAVAGSVRRLVDASPLTASMSVGVHDLLVEVGQLHPPNDDAVLVGADNVAVSWDPSRFTTAPVDSMFLAIYHGSIQVSKSFQIIPPFSCAGSSTASGGRI